MFPIRFHKEGQTLLLVLGLVLVAATWAIGRFAPALFWFWVCFALAIFVLIAQFFRNPVRKIPVANQNWVYAPADGKVCVIEEVEEPEYFKGKRLQVSIFMSPVNVHVNRNPVSGLVKYFRYHPGLYLVAWHPKSSTDNERTTVVYDTGSHEILMRQVAGALARRIKWYIAEGQSVSQGEDMGFIKFGSRVDLYLPLGSKVKVQMDEMVKGNQTVVAHLPE
jgi:phosphatidylserine decarboxylase